jgi:hypothetical protein
MPESQKIINRFLKLHKFHAKAQSNAKTAKA